MAATSAPRTRSAGTCANGKIIAAARVERRVLAGVREHLLAPEAIAQAVREMRESAEAEAPRSSR